jgi:hypothetical protein
MPTPLGSLPTNRAIPVAESTRAYSSVVAAASVEGLGGGNPLPDTGGGNWQITARPARDAFWVVEAEMLLTSPDAVWTYALYAMRISPADMDGILVGNYLGGYSHASLGWRSFQSSYMFRLQGGVIYTASLTMEQHDAYTQQYYTHWNWTRVGGLLVAESVT